ncbi:FkbM family methyltransferase [Chloroflexota bacterium]
MRAKIKSNIFSVFSTTVKPLRKTRLAKLGFVSVIYEFIFKHLYPWPETAVFTVEGSKMFLNPHDRSIMGKAFRGYILDTKEEITTQIFKKVVKNGDIVVDLGANMGYFTLLAARLVGNKGNVYAFEPAPANYNMLVKNVDLNEYKNVIANQKAVSDVVGVVKLYLSDKDIGSHTIRERHDIPQFTESQSGEFVEVESITLDEFFKDEKRAVNVIKMDVEGAELLALSGMERVIRQNKNLKMLVEFYPFAMREMGSSPEEFIRQLSEEYGFSIIAIDELRTPTNKCLKINNVEELMDLCKEDEKIVNLFLEKGR